MKKVNICTLTGNENYGNKLQHYALQTVIEKMGFKVDSTLFIYDNYFKYVIKNLLKRLLKKVYPTRYIKFKKFDSNIKYSNNVYYRNKLHGREKYDYYVVGSDQVWNTTFPSFNLMYLLKNINEGKKISYAASFGIDYIKKEYLNDFSSELKKFNHISVREDSGVEIINKLDDSIETCVLIDPTLLLTGEVWSSLAEKPKILKHKKYILNYFLGELSEEKKEQIELIAKKENCLIINLLEKNDPFYFSGPSEFLWLEKNAFLICTDSFHSSVFGLLFNRPFVVFDREDKEEKMNSRLDTLLNKFNLKNRRYNGKKLTKENLNHDYSEAYKILEKERKKSKEFLENALDIK